MNVSFVGIKAGTIVSMTNKIKNWGLGVRAGVDTSWHIVRSFSIVGDLALTALWEQFKVSRFDAAQNPITDTLVSHIYAKENQYAVKPVIEWMLGLKWETGLDCDAYHLAITAGWEEQVWFGQNKFLRVPGTAMGTGGDLSLQGLTLDVRFDF